MAILKSRIRRPVVLLTQTYPPDTPAVGQHMGDLAAELVRRGHRVVVVTSNRGYDDPSIVYPRQEVIAGAEVKRLPLSSFGKQRMGLRMLAAALFGLQCAWVCLRLPRPAAILYSTSPPFIGTIAAIVGRFRRVPSVFWIMDLVPDLLIASGGLREDSRLGRSLEWLTRMSLRTATKIIALDAYMRERVLARGNYASKIVVIPPWSPETIAESGDGAGAYRTRHGLRDETVIMYSGNHSVMNPLDTVLQAAERLCQESKIRFMFVGGGAARPAVERFVQDKRLTNVILAPSEPVDNLGALLAAADVHLVTLGDPMVGIIHPCKIYGAMAAGRPILYIGPEQSHVGDILSNHQIGWQRAHGDVDGVVEAILSAHRAGRAELLQRGRSANAAVRATWLPHALCAQVADVTERAMAL